MAFGSTVLGVLCLASSLTIALSHAYLADPPSRNLVAHWDGSETCPHCLNANGPSNVERRGNGIWPTAADPISHGLCGDPVQNRKDAPSLAEEPYMIPTAPQQVYKAGSIVQFKVAVSTHHYGHYEFRICKRALDGRTLPSASDGQACLDAKQLLRAPPAASCAPGDPRGDCQPIDEDNPGRWYLPPPEDGTQQADVLWRSDRASKLPAVSEVHTMHFLIPDDLVCEHCTLQWYYATANTCLPDSSYLSYFAKMQKAGWPAAKWSPFAMASWAKCSNICCGRSNGNFGEEFWNCADIRIVPSGDVANFNQSSSSAYGQICEWHIGTWSPCSANECNLNGSRTRIATCHCDGVPSLSTRCEGLPARPVQIQSCQGSCKKASSCKMQAWQECGARQAAVELDPLVSTCCVAPLTCKSYGSVWAQCEPPQSSLPKSDGSNVMNLTVTIGMQWPSGVHLCPELKSLAAMVALWAGADEVVALSPSCKIVEPPTRRLPSHGMNSAHEFEPRKNVDIESADFNLKPKTQDAQSVPQVSAARRYSNARGMAAKCPSNDIGCDCTWASADTCGDDDGSLCWCRCCCPMGGSCKDSDESIQKGARDSAQCTFPSQMSSSVESFDNRGFADKHGKLKLSGVQLVDENGDAVQLMGMSSHGLHWFPSCYAKPALLHLAQHWGINLFRVALYIGEGGYASQTSLLKSVKDIVDWCEELGIYVMIDWHILTPGDPNHWLTGAGKQQVDASKFWHDIATLYKGKKHVLYEICNEPNGVSWSMVKSYADKIITTIREVDAETIIIVGTPTWSQDIHLAAAAPVAQPYNVMYAFHFYSGTHRALLERVREFASQIPIFVTEWGTSQASGDGGPYLDTAQEFLDLFGAVKETGVLISWAQWSYADKAEASAALKPGSCSKAAWDDVSCSGAFVRNYIQNSATPNQTRLNGARTSSVGSSTSIEAESVGASNSITLAGIIHMLVPSPSRFVSETYAAIGVRNGIANISQMPANAVRVALSSSRRLTVNRTLRRMGITSIVSAKYNISLRESEGIEVAARMTHHSASGWSTVIQSKVSEAAAVAGSSFTHEVEVISISIPVLHIAAQWNVGPWGACSTSCGQGTQVRAVTCSTDAVLNAEACDDARRPPTTKECNLSACRANLSREPSIEKVTLHFVPKSSAHRLALSGRLADANHFKALEDSLILWLVSRFGAMELTGEGMGSLIRWCDGCNSNGDLAQVEVEDQEASSLIIFWVVFIPLLVLISSSIALLYLKRQHCIAFLSPKGREAVSLAPQHVSLPAAVWVDKAVQKQRTNLPTISAAAHATVELKPPHISYKEDKQDVSAFFTGVVSTLPGCCKYKSSKLSRVEAEPDAEDV